MKEWMSDVESSVAKNISEELPEPIPMKRLLMVHVFLTFLSRHFQNLKHILIKVSQDLHTKNKESFIENKSAKGE